MTTEIVRYRIDGNRATAFESSYRDAGAVLRGSAHCLSYRLLRGHEERDNWILIIEWDSVAGHERGFRQEPAFGKFLELVKPFFNDIQEMKHYDTKPMSWTRQTATLSS